MSDNADKIAEGFKLMQEAAKAATSTAVKSGDASKEQQEQVQYAICPCCGKPTLVKPVEVKGALLDHYMACLMSGVPFSHTYPVYKGKLLVTVTQLTKDTAASVLQACNVIDMCKTKLQTVTMIAQDIKNTLRMYCSVACIEIHDNGNNVKIFRPADTVNDTCEQLIAMRTDIVADSLVTDKLSQKLQLLHKAVTSPDVLSGVSSMLLSGVIETHHQIYNLLLDSGFDENFWEGIELA